MEGSCGFGLNEAGSVSSNVEELGCTYSLSDRRFGVRKWNPHVDGLNVDSKDCGPACGLEGHSRFKKTTVLVGE